MEGSSEDHLPQAPVESRTLGEVIRGLSSPVISRGFPHFSGQHVQSLVAPMVKNFCIYSDGFPLKQLVLIAFCHWASF